MTGLTSKITCAAILGLLALAFTGQTAKADTGQVVYTTTAATACPPGMEQYEVTPGRYDTQWVPPVYATALDAAGRPFTYVAQPGYAKTVWVAPLYGYRPCAAPVYTPSQTVVYTTAQPVCTTPVVIAEPAPVCVTPVVVAAPAPVCTTPVIISVPPRCDPPRSSVSLSFSFGSPACPPPRRPVIVCPPPRPVCAPPPVCHEPRRSYSGWSGHARDSGHRSSVNGDVNVRSRR